MIGYLKGKIISAEGSQVVLDVRDVGYDVHVGDVNEVGLNEVGREIALWVHTHVREDQITLFGFAERLQKKIFLILMGISGIGPKMALAATTLLSPNELVDAITFGNTKTLKTIPGVGKKMADRMVLELKDKFGGLIKQVEWSEVSAGSSTAVWNDLNEALSGLGFADAQIRNVIKLLRPEFEGKSPEINELLKLALQRIRN